ncbi:MAG: metal-dependent hydrolase [Rubricoccaceae bacterium]|nr:metal-dependent hydrolase [Rubricoccaceae bacterium]
MTITYFGHSAIQLSVNGTTVLVDPFITGNKHAEGVVSPDDLNPDVILLTHAHGDHWGDTPSIAQRANALVVANFEITSYLERELGYENTHPMNTGGSWAFDWGKVTQTYARHSSSFPDGTYGGNPNGYVLRAEGKCLYLAGDTCRFSEMSDVAAGDDIDVAFLPVGDDFTMGPEEAVECVKMLEPRLTVPIHYDTFPYIEIDMGRFTGAMDRAGYEARVLKAGETMTL